MNRSPRLVGFIVIGSLGLAGSTWARADAPKAPGQGRLTESFCKASATRKAAAAAMNKQGVTSSKVKFLRFEHLERVRKDEFCYRPSSPMASRPSSRPSGCPADGSGSSISTSRTG